MASDGFGNLRDASSRGLETRAPARDDGDSPSEPHAAAFPSSSCSSYRMHRRVEPKARRPRVGRRLLLYLRFDPAPLSQLPPRQQHKKNRLPSLAPPRQSALADCLMECRWLERVVLLFLRRPRLADRSTGVGKLRKEVSECEYSDVQVMWEVLQRKAAADDRVMDR